MTTLTLQPQITIWDGAIGLPIVGIRFPRRGDTTPVVRDGIASGFTRAPLRVERGDEIDIYYVSVVRVVDQQAKLRFDRGIATSPDFVVVSDGHAVVTPDNLVLGTAVIDADGLTILFGRTG